MKAVISLSRPSESDFLSFGRALLSTKLFSWTTIELPEAATVGMAPERIITAEEADSIKLRVENWTGDFYWLTMGDLEKLRSYENHCASESRVFGQSFTPNDAYDRPLLMLHPTGDWTILADVKYLPTSTVTNALKAVEAEVVQKWRLGALPLWNSHEKPQCSNVRDPAPGFSLCKWTPLCVISVSGKVSAGARYLLKPGRLEPIHSAEEAFRTVNQIMQPNYCVIQRWDQRAWSTMINLRVENAILELGRTLREAVQSPYLSRKAERAIIEIQKTFQKNMFKLHAVPQHGLQQATESFPFIETPYKRMFELIKMYQSMTNSFGRGDLTRAPVFREFNRIMRALWAEVLPISVNRTGGNWKQITVNDLLQDPQFRYNKTTYGLPYQRNSELATSKMSRKWPTFDPFKF